jgi:hypothetical protein
MPTRPILESHPVGVLRKEISKTNIKGYWKMKKAEVIDLMLKKENASKFSHIKMNVKKSKPSPPKQIPFKIQRPTKGQIEAEKAKKRAASPKSPDQRRLEAVKQILANRGEKMFEKMVRVNEEVYRASLKSRSAMEAIIKKAMIKLFIEKKLPTIASMVAYGNNTRLNELLDEIDEQIPETASSAGVDLFEAVEEVKRLKRINANPQRVRAALDKVKAIRTKLPDGYKAHPLDRVVPKK